MWYFQSHTEPKKGIHNQAESTAVPAIFSLPTLALFKDVFAAVSKGYKEAPPYCLQGPLQLQTPTPIAKGTAATSIITSVPHQNDPLHQTPCPFSPDPAPSLAPNDPTTKHIAPPGSAGSCGHNRQNGKTGILFLLLIKKCKNSFAF